MREIHLIVLWEFALPVADRILDDIRQHFEVLYDAMSVWPDEPCSCFRRFYGANLADANGKVRFCGGGAFRLFIVRDDSPVYGLRETSRGLERVNLNLFDAKTRYRGWSGGGHKVHTTNSTAEAARDIFLLTGHPASSWENGRPAGNLTVLPGQTGWKSLRELFALLDATLPYVILRNAESLPDNFDPSVHGDIDLLVPDADACASLLNARKVFPEPYRVHYEVIVDGRPIRFDFRFVGDDYYDRRWERKMLEQRIHRGGVNLLAPEDAFFALVHHALYQKFEIAADYVRKAAALAATAGIAWTGFDDALLQLEEFLARNGYEKTRPNDISVRWNTRLVNWHKLADEISALSGITDIRPFRLEDIREQAPLRPMFFAGEFNGQKCFVKYSPYACSLMEAEWKYPRMLMQNGDGDIAQNPVFWHKTCDGGGFSVTEWIEGEALSALIARNSPLLQEKADVIVQDLLHIADALKRAKIVHRDIRPANLVVTQAGNLKLIDFQFTSPEGDSREDPWFADKLAIIDGLGAEYALAPGQWNDRYSLLKILRELPPTSTRDAAILAIAMESETPTKVALCTKRQMKKFKRRRAILLRKKIASIFSSRKKRKFLCRYARELEFLNRIIATWHIEEH